MPSGWNAELKVSPGFMQYGVDTGYMLHYLAHQVRDIIRERTAKGRAIGGQPFAPYRERRAVERDEAGKIKRNAKGQWQESVVRGPQDPVRLRSPYTVAQGKRLLDNLIISPRLLEGKSLTMRKISAAYIRPSGSRAVSRLKRGNKSESAQAYKRDIRHAGSLGAAAKAVGMRRKEYKALVEAAGVVTDNVRHTARAATCQVGADSKNNPPRPFVGISPAEWGAVLAGIKRDHVLAFVQHQRREIRRQVGRKARLAARRAQTARKRGADAAVAAAESQHRQIVERYRSLFGGIAV